MVASASGRVALPIADVLAGRSRARGDLRVELDRVPLGEIPYFAHMEVGGHLSGRLQMNGIGDKPSLHADLHLPDLGIVYDHNDITRVGRAEYHADVSVDLRAPVGGRSPAAATLALSSGGGELGRERVGEGRLGPRGGSCRSPTRISRPRSR